MVKTVHLYLDEKDYETLIKLKKSDSWRKFILKLAEKWNK